MISNQVIREKARESGVRFWQLADHFHCSEATFTRKLRRELPLEEQNKILQAIDQIKAGEKECG